MVKKILKGEKYIVRHPKVPTQQAEVVLLTQEPGRHVGVQFQNPIDGGHDLGGAVPAGTGYWVHPMHLMTNAEFRMTAQAVGLSQITYDQATGQVS